MINSTTAPTYKTESNDDAILEKAENILLARIKTSGDEMNNSDNVRKFLKLKLSTKEREIFCCLFLDTQHRLIAFKEMFAGTIDSAYVYPREVIKKALECNAAAIIFAHNHPSGVCEPSDADLKITRKLKDGLALVDIRVLDHIIISGWQSYSFAQNGIM